MTFAFCGDTARIDPAVSGEEHLGRARSTSVDVIAGMTCVRQLMLVRDARARLALEEVADVLLDVGAALGLVALGVRAVVSGQRPFLGAIELAQAPKPCSRTRFASIASAASPASILPSCTAAPSETVSTVGVRPPP